MGIFTSNRKGIETLKYYKNNRGWNFLLHFEGENEGEKIL